MVNCCLFKLLQHNADYYRYLKLIKASDGDEYSANSFLSARVHNFKLVIVTQLPAPPPELVGLTYVIKVHTPEPSIY